MAFQPSEHVVLPIGLDIEGVRYREVIIDEMTGYDDEALANKKHRNNGAKAMSDLLRRCIQAIPGLVPQKKKRYSKIDRKYVLSMYAADRDFLFLSIRALGMEPSFDLPISCPRCGEEHEHEIVIAEMDVLEMEPGTEAALQVTLPKGFESDGKFLPVVTWKFPNGNQQERIASMPRNKVATATITSCIHEVEGLGRRPDTEMVRRLRTRDRMFLMQCVREYTPGVDLRIECFCSECQHEWVGEVDPSHFFNMGNVQTPKASKNGKLGSRKRRKLSQRQ